MKRMTALALSLTIALGAVPAEAQVSLGRATIATVPGAPAPVPALVAPAAGSLALPLAVPSLAPSLALAPVPSATAIPAPAAPAPAPAASPAASPATPIQALKAAAVLPAASAVVFDGAVRPAASAPDPVEPPPSARTPVRNPLKRYWNSRKDTTPVLTSFSKGAFAGTLAGVALPPLLLMTPALKAASALAAANLLLLAVLLPLTIGTWAWRKFRASPQAARPPPSRARLVAVATVGLLLGAGLGVTPYHATGPYVERVEMYIERNKTPAEQENVRWIRGGAVEDETAKVLSANPVGREVLAKLRDRFGVLRLPTFFVSNQEDSHAQHENMFDGVYINAGSILERGWTVEQFLKDPALQRRLIREIDSTILHELVHAVQGRRPPWTPGYLTNTIESEQEAFHQEVLYGVARLEADPKALNNGHDSWMIIQAVDNLDGFLDEVAQMYPENVVIGKDPYFNAYMAAQRAAWPAYRVRVYLLLSQRATAPGSAKMYLQKARDAAKAAGLPDPAPLSASR